MPGRSRFWLLSGLFCTAASTLCLEILNTRLFSVAVWYHLSFFVVSTALFGLSAGAMRVYLGGPRYAGERALPALRAAATLYALSIPLCHLVAVLVPHPPSGGIHGIVAAAVATLALAIPFGSAGFLVTLVLTRLSETIGRAYAVDLVGAALGALCVVPLLAATDVSSAVFATGGLAALGAIAFALHAGQRFPLGNVLLAAASFAAALWNGTATDGVRVWYPKGRYLPAAAIAEERWNVDSQVVVYRQPLDSPHYWGPGLGSERFRVPGVRVAIDGGAETVVTRWDGRRESLAWTAYDVTALPYVLRPDGEVAIVGCGGGRDVLTALAAGSRHVTGIEVNRSLIDLLQGPLRSFANLADRPEVELVHAEARGHLARTERRFDVVQMSLIDTWAATGAGALTLTENGLYTVEAWGVFLDVLRPEGVLGVSRWYDPREVSETSRLVSLASASLLRRGVAEPRRHVALLSCGNVATLLASPDPLRADDLTSLRATAERLDFRVLALPGGRAADPGLEAILAARTIHELDRVSQTDRYDFTPPTDDRPYFFNVLKPGAAFTGSAQDASEGVADGNLKATSSLALLAALSALLVLGVICVPLLRLGAPRGDARGFLPAMAYFAAIGLGYMFVQVALVQRFSIYLGQPAHSIVVTLSTMIVASGAGSLLSTLLPVERRPALLRVLPLLVALALLAVASALRPILEATTGLGLLSRSLIVAAVVAPPSLLLGACLAIGVRLVRRCSERILPWAFGVNGACSVLATVLAVGVSIWWGIGFNLWIAILLYASLVASAPALERRGRQSGPAVEPLASS